MCVSSVSSMGNRRAMSIRSFWNVFNLRGNLISKLMITSPLMLVALFNMPSPW